MLFQDAIKSTVTVTIGDKTYSIPVLTLRKASELLDEWARQKRGEVIGQHKDAGASSAEIAAALAEFDRSSRSLVTAIRWCGSFAFAAATIDKAAGEPLSERLPPTADVFELAMQLWGADIKPIGEPEGNAAGQSNNATG